MAGLGRVQQRFNAAVVGALALLVGFARQGQNEAQAAQWGQTTGHPIHRKYLKASNPNSNTPGDPYPGYCSGAREIERRRQRQARVYEVITLLFVTKPEKTR